MNLVIGRSLQLDELAKAKGEESVKKLQKCREVWLSRCQVWTCHELTRGKTSSPVMKVDNLGFLVSDL